MQLTCPHCHALCDFGDRRPSFCPFCGKGLPPDQPTLPLPAPGVTPSEAATLAAAPPSAPVQTDDPETIGGYRLLRVLGVGGMGKVYEAEDIATSRRVALKLVSADYAHAADALERFRQEGRLASLIVHPRCVFVLAADEENGRPYIVMELMPGDNLDDHIRHWGGLPPPKAVALLLDVIEGLQEAHRVGVVHRDVKPSNCFFGADGRLKIGDFGLSKSLVVTSAHLTKTGSFLGTPLYASPEQVRGELVDAQSDVYAVAATLYYVLTGRAPFQSDNAAVTLARIAADPAPSLRTLRPELSPLLDAVVLRGLERDRKRRWQNLDEFAEALRPFLRDRLSLAGLGVRFGAWMLDLVILWIAAAALESLLIPLAGIDVRNREAQALVATVLQLGGLVLWQLYFGLPEGLWGWSLGKWLVGLRVRNVALATVPGLGRGLLRALLTNVLFHLGSILSSLILLPLLQLPLQPTPGQALNHEFAYRVAAVVTGVGYVVGISLIVYPMRTRNGFRGLHEFASGTGVVSPSRRRPWTVAVPLPSQTLSRPPGVPEQIGAFDHRGVFRAFEVRGAFRWDDRARILLGFDPALGRQVVLWLRHRDEPGLGAARREVNRTTRLRWLAAGPFGAFQWDAFVVPDGCSLPALVEANGRMHWPQAQVFLQQLLDELRLAIQEETLPARPEPSMVWVRADGQAILLDMPLTGAAPLTATAAAHATATSVDRAFDLLARVAVLALEGHPAPEKLPNRVAAPLPLPAAVTLDELLHFAAARLSLHAFQQRLQRLQEKPPEVTRGRRAAQLALMTVFLFVAGGFLPPLANYLAYSAWLHAANGRIERDQQALDDLDRADLSDCLCVGLNTEVLARLRLAAVVEEDRQISSRLATDLEQTRKKMDERGRWDDLYRQNRAQTPGMSVVPKFAFQLGKPQPLYSPGQYRQRARTVAAAADATPLQGEDDYETLILWGFFVGPLLWIGEAFALRGGLSYLLTGIALVGRNGRAAARFRSAWRALLAWGPVAGLLFGSHQLDRWYWSAWTPAGGPEWLAWLATVLYGGTWVLLGTYAVLALRNPTRSPLDKLAGTYLVPSR